VHLPRKENARSRHQRLFEENVGKTEKVWSTNFKRERFESCFTHGEGISTPRVHHKGRQPPIKCANMTFKMFNFPFFFMAFCVFIFFVVDKGVSLTPTYFSIAMRKSDLRSSLRTKRLVKLFLSFSRDIF